MEATNNKTWTIGMPEPPKLRRKARKCITPNENPYIPGPYLIKKSERRTCRLWEPLNNFELSNEEKDIQAAYLAER